jgi:biopolymer transport protein ExbD
VPLKTHQDDLPAINLTPMIDIVFNLIIFFMVSTRFTEMERKVDLTVPQVANHQSLADIPKSRAINVYRDGRITLDGAAVTLRELTDQLAAVQRQDGHQNVVVRGDADGPFQNVAAVFSACQKAGIAEMGISVRLASGPTTTQER